MNDVIDFFISLNNNINHLFLSDFFLNIFFLLSWAYLCKLHVQIHVPDLQVIFHFLHSCACYNIGVDCRDVAEFFACAEQPYCFSLSLVGGTAKLVFAHRLCFSPGSGSCNGFFISLSPPPPSQYRR